MDIQSAIAIGGFIITLLGIGVSYGMLVQRQKDFEKNMSSQLCHLSADFKDFKDRIMNKLFYSAGGGDDDQTDQ